MNLEQRCLWERFSPDEWRPPWIRHANLGRYRWACQFTRGRRVIDAACGTGYGSELLARNGAAAVAAFDLSSQAVAQAVIRCRDLQQVAVATCDVTCLPVNSGEHDVYVCFETIEHVIDDTALLAEAERVLRPGGTFVCSTPNRCVSNPGKDLADQPLNVHHLREYSWKEFEVLLRSYFRHIRWYGQVCYDVHYIGLLARLGRRLPTMAARIHQARKLPRLLYTAEANYLPVALAPDCVPETLIAVCTR